MQSKWRERHQRSAIRSGIDVLCGGGGIHGVLHSEKCFLKAGAFMGGVQLLRVLRRGVRLVHQPPHQLVVRARQLRQAAPPTRMRQALQR